jgi:hypothetical protein
MSADAEENALRKQIADRMKLKETDELLEVWRKSDREEWTDIALEVVKEILIDRLGEIPLEKGADKPEDQKVDTSATMDISQFVFQNLPEKQNIQALENCVIVEHKNPVREFRLEFDYKELKSKLVSGRDSEAGWTTLGWYILCFLVILSMIISIVIPKVFSVPTNRILALSLVALALISFALRLIKHDCVWIMNQEDEAAFKVKLTNRNRNHGEEFVRFIKNKIEKAELQAKSE